MDIIPAVDIRGGRCVRLEQGDYARETVFGDDPAAMALHWQALGARRLHVIDLDGARSGHTENREAIEAIVRAASVPVQVGGGIRSAGAIGGYVRAGAARVIIGTSAVRDEAMLGEATRDWPESIVVSVDARDGVVTTDGWTRDASERAEALIARMLAAGVRRFIYTDVVRDGTLTEPNYAAIEALVRGAGAPIIAAGGIAKVEHLLRLAELGVEGAIVGKALYTGDIDLAAALEAVGDGRTWRTSEGGA